MSRDNRLLSSGKNNTRRSCLELVETLLSHRGAALTGVNPVFLENVGLLIFGVMVLLNRALLALASLSSCSGRLLEMRQ